jgi:hypothetical protein
VVTVELCWSRVMAGALIPELPAEGRERLSRPAARSDRALPIPHHVLRQRPDPLKATAKGALERSHRFMRSNFLPGRRFANRQDFQL